MEHKTMTQKESEMMKDDVEERCDRLFAFICFGVITICITLSTSGEPTIVPLHLDWIEIRNFEHFKRCFLGEVGYRYDVASKMHDSFLDVWNQLRPEVTFIERIFPVCMLLVYFLWDSWWMILELFTIVFFTEIAYVTRPLAVGYLVLYTFFL